MDIDDWSNVGRLLGSVLFPILDCLGPEVEAYIYEKWREDSNNPALPEEIPIENDNSIFAARVRQGEVEARRANFKLIDSHRRPEEIDFETDVFKAAS